MAAKKKAKKTVALKLPRATDEELRTFVDGVVSGRIFTSAHLGAREGDLLGLIFMPLAFGALSRYRRASLKQVGVCYEEISKAMPRGINGYPTFGSVRMLHIDDWERARKAIDAERERRKTIPV